MERKPYLDFRQIKDNVPIASLCSRYGIELRKRNTKQMVAKVCPLPTHDNPKSLDTFSVNVTDGVWKCWHSSCRSAKAQGNVLDLAMRLSNLSQYDAAKQLLDWFPLSGNPATHPATEPATNHIADAGKMVNSPLAFTLKGILHEHPMIQGRCISVDTAREFGIGYFPGKGSMAGRIVVPLYEDGNLIGYAGRTTLEVTADNPKWRLPAGLVKSFLYGLERCDPSKPLILCESFWAVPFFFEKGHQAASIMGSDLTDAQERRLTDYKTIVVAMDDDSAGRAAAERLCAKLKPNRSVLKAYLRE